LQNEITDTRHRVGDVEDSIADLTSDDGLFGAAIGIGLGSAALGAGLALGVANAAGSAGFGVAASLGTTAATASDGVMRFVNQTFGDQRGVYQSLAASEAAASEIEVTAEATEQAGSWQFARFSGF
jgi:hypothetical protein